MHLVVGLGNPGSEYVGTRHNVGWEVLDALAVSLGWIKKPGDFERLARGKFDAITLDGNVSGEKVLSTAKRAPECLSVNEATQGAFSRSQ